MLKTVAVLEAVEAVEAVVGEARDQGSRADCRWVVKGPRLGVEGVEALPGRTRGRHCELRFPLERRRLIMAGEEALQALRK